MDKDIQIAQDYTMEGSHLKIPNPWIPRFWCGWCLEVTVGCTLIFSNTYIFLITLSVNYGSYSCWVVLWIFKEPPVLIDYLEKKISESKKNPWLQLFQLSEISFLGKPRLYANTSFFEYFEREWGWWLEGICPSF